MEYRDFFSQAMKKPMDPYAYQAALASAPDWPDSLDVPTGMGKTAAVTLAWLWKRGWRDGQRQQAPDATTPRRLVWCLPMRVLVEQTERSIKDWLDALGIGGNAGDKRVSAHVLMGGESDLSSWAEHPEEDMILIGTQDMLLSRALMRGYGMSRYQWPIHFALLHNDAMWAFDEVQLMGAGLPTSTQLEGIRRNLMTARPSRSLWLSATLNRDWLDTIDMRPFFDGLTTLSISDEDRAQAGERLQSIKTVSCAPISLDKSATTKAGTKAHLDKVAEMILASHEPGHQTLVIVNRVDRAQGLYRRLAELRPNREDLLIHARFRANERAEQSTRLHLAAETDRIVIATQAIEAGVDISSKVMITELAPWPSLVQRFGRCNRYGEHNDQGGAHIIWIDIDDDADVLPYSSDQLAAARVKLNSVTSASPDDLPRTDEPRPASAIVRRKDLLDLFNTDPDLSGFDVDVSDYIRDSGTPGVRVFWRAFEDPNRPEAQCTPTREELCPVSIGQIKNLAKKRDLWHWDSLEQRWVKLQRVPRPGMTILMKAVDGGYDAAIGFDATIKKPPVPVIAPSSATHLDGYGEDWRSRQARPVMLDDHLAHVASHATKLCNALGETAHAEPIVRASRWHDIGKLHEVFDATMHCCDDAPPGFLAKSPCRGRHGRRFFRHELASMLAWLEQNAGAPDADLIAYLIVAHHGKVRMSLRAMPTEQAEASIERFARGVWEGDVLPAFDFDGERSEATTLRLALMEIGDGDQGMSWTARAIGLLAQHGPFQLAWLETLVRLADWRASAAEQSQEGATSDA